MDARIKDAARRLFLQRGLAGTSIDEIARHARAGKATIYARYATKQDLFAAIAADLAARVVVAFEGNITGGEQPSDDIATLGTEILDHLLVADLVDFLRLCVAEARRFPDLAGIAVMMRKRGAEAVHTILSEISRSDPGKVPALAAERLPQTTQYFLDLVVAPLLMRAVFGEELGGLRGRVENQVKARVAFFLAACTR